jgi:hypothetical protein
MTMKPLELERKVRQLDNDVQSIYELLLGIQGTQGRHTNRLDELATDIDAIGGRLSAVDGRLDSLEHKLDLVLDMLKNGRTAAAS